MLLPQLAHAEITFSHFLPDQYWPVNKVKSLISGDNTNTRYSWRIDIKTGSITYDIYDDNFNVIESFSDQLPEYHVEYTSGNHTDTKSTYNIAYMLFPNGIGYTYSLFKPYFGTSGKYEYIIPLTCSETVSYTSEYGTTYVNTSPVNGFTVKNEDGEEVVSVRFPAGYYAPINENAMYINIDVVNNRLKALIPVMHKQGERYNLVYDLGSADAGARTVACSPKLVNICPTLVGEGETVNVTVGEEIGGPKEISVISAAGSVVYRVSTTDNTVSIPAALLPPGMNIVRVSYSNGKQETSRIMVR